MVLFKSTSLLKTDIKAFQLHHTTDVYTVHTSCHTCYHKDTHASISEMCEMCSQVKGSMSVSQKHTACP